ncbi:Fic family protein [Aeromonas veronii]|uniref:Fic family protein n=1 Tax=Aeromonas veronii TaxID=654 RepID=UPI0015E644B9|nr:Fic family protein [Aeromonas veronii]MBA2083013.1 cell filamentation protein Fic [Aeromonas veronii]
MLKKPPIFDHAEFVSKIHEYLGDDAQVAHEYTKHMAPIDDKGRYLHYDELRHRVKAPALPEIAWGFKKLSRAGQVNNVLPLGDTGHDKGELVGRLFLTPTIQKAISLVDKLATTAHLQSMMARIGELTHLEYLLNDLIDDEAISSSQLEGAATTTIVAKDMLRRKRKPRTADERMIIGNYLMMDYAWEHRKEPLSIELIQSLHEIGVEGIDDEEYTPGVFRMDDSVAVVDGDDQVVHQPPKAELLDERMLQLCTWINLSHDDIESSTYIHPVVKAILLHFCIGFEHPFRDGNGRVARALFYWFMFKSDYGAFRYIAISTLLRKAATRYGKSYVYTETDDMDLTYFVDYQCSIILRALKRFTETYEKNVLEVQQFNLWMLNSGLYGKLTEKQRIILHNTRNACGLKMSANFVKDKLDCSYNTASNALKGMVELGLLNATAEGRQTVYSIKPLDEIKQSWDKKGFN